MQITGIPDTRISRLNDRDIARGRYVLYWMQQSQRARWNHALEVAVHLANGLSQGVVVLFALLDDYPEANLRHYTFMLEGLAETAGQLAARGIRMVLSRGTPPVAVARLAGEASLIVCDRGYLRHQRQWREAVARQAACRVVQVESDVVVPVASASGKAEIGARTLRPKIRRQLEEHLQPPPAIPVSVSSLGYPTAGEEIGPPAAILATLPMDRRVPAVSARFPGGTSQAEARLENFLEQRLAGYATCRNRPEAEGTSGLSPYLHFGQISPLFIACQVMAAAAAPADREAFLEELIVRRELACNFTHHTPDYDTYGCTPAWARQSLEGHRTDPRPHRYPIEQLEAAATHDPYWNAAMRDMRCTGYLHNTLRMYWGKKILEWSPTPAAGFAATLTLNNRYFLDGRDPSSFAGVAWLYGLHDRAWPPRPITGKVRCMTAAGLARKYDMRAYLRQVEARCTS